MAVLDVPDPDCVPDVEPRMFADATAKFLQTGMDWRIGGGSQRRGGEDPINAQAIARRLRNSRIQRICGDASAVAKAMTARLL